MGCLRRIVSVLLGTGGSIAAWIFLSKNGLIAMGMTQILIVAIFGLVIAGLIDTIFGSGSHPLV